MPEFEAKIETTVTVDFEVFCDRCGAGLCNKSTGGNTPHRNQPFVRVEPCEACLREAADEARVDAETEAEELIKELEARIQELEAAQ